MESGIQLFHAIYTRFVLRDFVGKVIPGGIVILGTGAVFSNVQTVTAKVHDMTKFELAILISLAWITTIAMQSFGDFVGLFRYFPGEFHTSTANVNEFLRLATDDEKAQYERFVVLKEASGNTATALSVVFAFNLYNVLYEVIATGIQVLKTFQLKQDAALLIAWLAAIFFLAKMHTEHVSRQYQYVESTLKAALERGALLRFRP